MILVDPSPAQDDEDFDLEAELENALLRVKAPLRILVYIRLCEREKYQYSTDTSTCLSALYGINIYICTVSSPILGDEGAPSEPAQQKRRPPASPATAGAVHVKGQTPVKSPETKKPKVDSETASSSRVEEFQAKVDAKSTTPTKPLMDIDEDFLDRTAATPKNLGDMFEGVALSTLVESPEATHEADEQVPCHDDKYIYMLFESMKTSSTTVQHKISQGSADCCQTFRDAHQLLNGIFKNLKVLGGVNFQHSEVNNRL